MIVLLCFDLQSTFLTKEVSGEFGVLLARHRGGCCVNISSSSNIDSSNSCRLNCVGITLTLATIADYQIRL